MILQLSPVRMGHPETMKMAGAGLVPARFMLPAAKVLRIQYNQPVRPIFFLCIGLIVWQGPLDPAGSQPTCPSVLKMVSSNPVHNAMEVSPDASIVFTWDRDLLQELTDGLRDLKPALEFVNIAGGRYGMGTLLTTEWGIGGRVTWEDHREVIFPEAPLEPGTQYRVWTYLFRPARRRYLTERGWKR